METLLIGVAGFILSFLVIYLISVFSMREKTFEEVLEEQRKRLEEEERKAKSERRAEKGERKKYRKFKEKPKEKSLSTPRETQPSPTASNTKILVPPVTEIIVETVSSATAVPTSTSIKTSSPKSSKKAQKSLSDGNNLGGSSSSNVSGKNVKPLVAGSSASSVPVCMEETIEKNVQQVTALEKGNSNKNNSGKESKITRKISPSKQSSSVLSSPAEQQKQKHPQPQEQQKKTKQTQEQQKQPQEQQKQQQKPKQPQPQEQQKPKQSQPQEQQKQQKPKQPQPQDQQKQQKPKQPQPQDQQKQQKPKQPQPQDQQKQQKPKQPQPQDQQKQQKPKQPQPQDQQKQQKPKQPQPQDQQKQQKQKQPQPQDQQKQQKQKQPQPQDQQKQQKPKQPQPQEQQKPKQPQPQEQQKQQKPKQPQPQEQQKSKQPQEQQKSKQPQPQEQQKQQQKSKQSQPHEQQKQQKLKQLQPHEQQKQKQLQQQEQQKQQQEEKQQKQQQLQKQQQQRNTSNNKGANNSQTQQNTKSNVDSKGNTKTSKAAKQNANEALEKQILIVEQNQKLSSSNEENVTKKLSKKAKKVAAATIATDIQFEEKSVKDQAPKENFQKRKSGNETTGVMQLISSVKATVLNDSEIQTLLDLLQSKLNKKSQKTDYVAGLLKQLEEKEKRIIDVTEGEVKAHQAVTGLKQKILNTEKLYENKIKKLMDENKTLQSQVKKTQLQYEQNMTALTDQMKQLESNTVTKECYQKIVDEVNKLSVPVIPVIDPAEMASMKQKVQIMEKELNNNVLKLNNSEKKRKKFEDKIKEFEAKIKNENKKLEELNLALKNSNNEKALLTEKSNKANEALKATQTECASLKCQLKDKELNNKEAEKNMMNLSKRVEELEEELEIVKQKNMILLEENKLVREKPVKMEVNLGERQEPAGAPNGDVQQESLACTKVALVEHERLLGEKQSEIVRLTAELGNKETETKARVDEKESEIRTLTSSLNTQIGEIEKLREEILAFKNKNDELRKRNWKAMEAVEKAEKSAVEKISNAVKNTMQCQSLDKSVLMRIFPDISVTESLEHDIWLKSFEVEAVNYIKGLKETSESVRKLEKAEMMKKELEIRLNELEKKLSEAQISKSETVEDLHKQIDVLTAELKESTLKYTELQTNSEETKTKLEDRLKELKSAFSETKTLCMSLKEKLENAPINNSTEEYEKQVDTLMVQLKESNETVAKLETQVKKYQNLLKVTDDKLQVLQRSVEDEELKWRREQQTLQKSLMEAQQELEELRKNQVDQTFAQSLEAVNSQTEKEYKLLRLQVEEDEKKVRDLSQTIVKLNGIIKTGQDALSQEQELVCKLKQQLADKNSTESPSAAQEVEELKKKLAQKEKEVEQGQLYNNALSQKLASAVSSNDVGTSV